MRRKTGGRARPAGLRGKKTRPARSPETREHRGNRRPIPSVAAPRPKRRRKKGPGMRRGGIKTFNFSTTESTKSRERSGKVSHHPRPPGTGRKKKKRKRKYCGQKGKKKKLGPSFFSPLQRKKKEGGCPADSSWNSSAAFRRRAEKWEVTHCVPVCPCPAEKKEIEENNNVVLGKREI